MNWSTGREWVVQRGIVGLSCTLALVQTLSQTHKTHSHSDIPTHNKNTITSCVGRDSADDQCDTNCTSVNHTDTQQNNKHRQPLK